MEDKGKADKESPTCPQARTQAFQSHSTLFIPYNSWTRGSQSRVPSSAFAAPRAAAALLYYMPFHTESAPMATAATASAMNTGLVSSAEESIAEGSYGS